MAITLDAIELPEDLMWTNEYLHSHINNQISKTLSGRQIIEESAQQKGRQINLEGGIDYGWVERVELNQLQTKKETAEAVMLLTLNDGRSFNVMFRRDINPLQARLIIDYNEPADTDYYSLKLFFLEV